MSRKSQQSKRSRNDSNIEPSKPRTASDVINSFLKKKEKTKPDSKFRSASDVINSFLQREKPAKEPSRPKFRSALDVINSHLQKTSKESVRRKSSHKRKIIDSSTSDSDSDSSTNHTVKRRRIDSNTPNYSPISDSQRSKECQTSIGRSGVEISNDESPQHGGMTPMNLQDDGTTPAVLDSDFSTHDLGHPIFTPDLVHVVESQETISDSQRSKECQTSIDRSCVEISNDESPQHGDMIPAVLHSDFSTHDLGHPIFTPDLVQAIESQETIRLSGRPFLVSKFIPTVPSMSIGCTLAEDSQQHVTLITTEIDESSSTNLLRADRNTQDDVQEEFTTLSNEVRLDTTLVTIDETSHLNLSINDADNDAEGEESGQNKSTKRDKSSSSLKTPARRTVREKGQGYKWITKPSAVPDKSGKVRDIVVNLFDYKIPKSKYDEALDILNSDENRYDETPVNYASRYSVNKRKKCQNRRFHEATYEYDKIECIRNTSLSRVIWEMNICLKNENWNAMAELVYFGCDIMNPHDRYSSKGTSFFTYALLGLLMDSDAESLSTLESKNNTLIKYFKALGAEEDEYEAFMQELNLIPKDTDTISNDDTTICETEEIEL